MSKYIPTGKGFFSGIGLMELGIMQAGCEIVQSLDIDKQATDVMRINPKLFSHKILTRDISTITIEEQPKTDFIVATYPCTKYSDIADLHGTRTGDELYLHAFRHFAIEQPEMYVLENVPGMKKFPVVMEAMSKLPGYYVYEFCPLKSSTWLPQERDRLIIIGTKRPFSISYPEAPKVKPRLRDIIETDAPIEPLNPSIISRLNGDYRDRPIITDPDDDNAIAPCCVAHYAKDKGTRLVKDRRHPQGVRSYTIREYARLQGVPDEMILPTKGYAYKQIGNGVPVDMGRWIGQQIMRYFN